MHEKTQNTDAQAKVTISKQPHSKKKQFQSPYKTREGKLGPVNKSNPQPRSINPFDIKSSPTLDTYHAGLQANYGNAASVQRQTSAPIYKEKNKKSRPQGSVLQLSKKKEKQQQKEVKRQSNNNTSPVTPKKTSEKLPLKRRGASENESNLSSSQVTKKTKIEDNDKNSENQSLRGMAYNLHGFSHTKGGTEFSKKGGNKYNNRRSFVNGILSDVKNSLKNSSNADSAKSVLIKMLNDIKPNNENDEFQSKIKFTEEDKVVDLKNLETAVHQAMIAQEQNPKNEEQDNDQQKIEEETDETQKKETSDSIKQPLSNEVLNKLKENENYVSNLIQYFKNLTKVPQMSEGKEFIELIDKVKELRRLRKQLLYASFSITENENTTSLIQNLQKMAVYLQHKLADKGKKNYSADGDSIKLLDKELNKLAIVEKLKDVLNKAGLDFMLLNEMNNGIDIFKEEINDSKYEVKSGPLMVNKKTDGSNAQHEYYPLVYDKNKFTYEGYFYVGMNGVNKVERSVPQENEQKHQVNWQKPERKRELPENDYLDYRPIIVHRLTRKGERQSKEPQKEIWLGAVHTTPYGTEFDRRDIYKELEVPLKYLQTKAKDEGAQLIMGGDYYIAEEALVKNIDIDNENKEEGKEWLGTNAQPASNKLRNWSLKDKTAFNFTKNLAQLGLTDKRPITGTNKNNIGLQVADYYIISKDFEGNARAGLLHPETYQVYLLESEDQEISNYWLHLSDHLPVIIEVNPQEGYITPKGWDEELFKKNQEAFNNNVEQGKKTELNIEKGDYEPYEGLSAIITRILYYIYEQLKNISVELTKRIENTRTSIKKNGLTKENRQNISNLITLIGDNIDGKKLLQEIIENNQTETEIKEEVIPQMTSEKEFLDGYEMWKQETGKVGDQDTDQNKIEEEDSIKKIHKKGYVSDQGTDQNKIEEDNYDGLFFDVKINKKGYKSDQGIDRGGTNLCYLSTALNILAHTNYYNKLQNSNKLKEEDWTLLKDVLGKVKENKFVHQYELYEIYLLLKNKINLPDSPFKQHDAVEVVEAIIKQVRIEKDGFFYQTQKEVHNSSNFTNEEKDKYSHNDLPKLTKDGNKINVGGKEEMPVIPLPVWINNKSELVKLSDYLKAFLKQQNNNDTFRYVDKKDDNHRKSATKTTTHAALTKENLPSTIAFKRQILNYGKRIAPKLIYPKEFKMDNVKYKCTGEIRHNGGTKGGHYTSIAGGAYRDDKTIYNINQYNTNQAERAIYYLHYELEKKYQDESKRSKEYQDELREGIENAEWEMIKDRKDRLDTNMLCAFSKEYILKKLESSDRQLNTQYNGKIIEKGKSNSLFIESSDAKAQANKILKHLGAQEIQSNHNIYFRSKTSFKKGQEVTFYLEFYNFQRNIQVEAVNIQTKRR